MEYIAKHIAEKDESPTYEEIAAGIGCTAPSARDFVLALAGREYISFTPSKQRSITITE